MYKQILLSCVTEISIKDSWGIRYGSIRVRHTPCCLCGNWKFRSLFRSLFCLVLSRSSNCSCADTEIAANCLKHPRLLGSPKLVWIFSLEALSLHIYCLITLTCSWAHWGIYRSLLKMSCKGDLNRFPASWTTRVTGERVCILFQDCTSCSASPLPCFWDRKTEEWGDDNIKLRYLFPVVCLEHIQAWSTLDHKGLCYFSRHTRFGACIAMTCPCVPVLKTALGTWDSSQAL